MLGIDVGGQRFGRLIAVSYDKIVKNGSANVIVANLHQ